MADSLLPQPKEINMSIGLSELVLILVVVVKCFSLPFRLIWNGICGAVALWFINLIGGFLGFGLKITVIKALIAGFFGIPGCLAVILWELYAR